MNIREMAEKREKSSLVRMQHSVKIREEERGRKSRVISDRHIKETGIALCTAKHSAG